MNMHTRQFYLSDL